MGPLAANAHVLTMRGDIILGSEVWIASNALILSGVTIGDGAVVGPGSVVVEDVPPYSIVVGNPARVVSKRFSNDVIAELLELRWWGFDPQQVESLRPLLERSDIAAFPAACRRCRGLPPKSHEQPRSAAAPMVAVTTGPASSDLAAQVVAAIARECPSFSAADMTIPFDRLGIDSFGMLTTRIHLEEAANKAIDNLQWADIATPADIVKTLGAAVATGHCPETGGRATERRRYILNMPQMALGGVSESWLFKEFGDIHWKMLAKGLGRRSHMLRDDSGERIYATFTRFQLNSTCPLATYRDNERVEFDASLSRYGAGIYFSEAAAKGESKSVRARPMSSFSKFGPPTSNTSLVKGLPEIPADCNIPVPSEFPEFGRDYRARRAQTLPPAIFECEYEIISSYDINGVGLLYFAAYPIINDICAARYAGRSFATDFSTLDRDVFCFGNSDPDDTLIYRLHRWTAANGSIEMESSISRKSDGNLMAHILTRNVLVDQSTPREEECPSAAT